jgi:hypothetical protein
LVKKHQDDDSPGERDFNRLVSEMLESINDKMGQIQSSVNELAKMVQAKEPPAVSGDQGDKGDKGDKGERGPRGFRGKQGERSA